MYNWFVTVRLHHSNPTLQTMNRLIGKTAIVTGANSGMGMATARALLDEGATVIMLCRSENRGKEAYKKLLEDGIEKNETSDKLNDYIEFIKECFTYFKENVDWCKKNQPYLMQLRYNFSTRKYKDTDFEVF